MINADKMDEFMGMSPDEQDAYRRSRDQERAVMRHEKWTEEGRITDEVYYDQEEIEELEDE